MLGTRIILMGMDGFPGGITGEPNAEMICAANHEIPLFWLLGFSESELETYVVDSAPDDVLSHQVGASYPILMAECADLIQRVEQRQAILASLISEHDSALLQRWIQFLSELQYPVLAIDTYELWCNMADPESLHQEILALLRRFDSMDTTGASVGYHALVNDGKWIVDNSITLAGYGW